MRVIAFDQSLTASAAVILEEQGNKLTINQQFVFCPKTRGIRRLVEIRDWMFKIVDHERPDIMVRELHNQRQFGAAAALQNLSCMLDMLSHDYSYLEDGKYAMITAGTWKKFCVGKGNLKKDTAYLIHLNKFIKKNPFLVVNEDFSVTNDNIADAICLGITGWAAWKVNTAKPIMLTEDQRSVLVKAIPVMFEYGI